MSAIDRLRAYAGLGGRAVLSRVGALRPFKLTLSLTERCDCRCQACFIWRRGPGPEPSPEAIRGALAGAPWIRWVNLTGGEIFLRDDVPAVARAVVDALPRLAVLDFPTTGQRTARIVADVSEIAALGVPRLYVTVSLEGPPQVHDRLRGRPGAFERMVETYARLRGIAGARTYLGMTLSDANAHLVEEALEAVRARVPGVGWKDLHLNVLTTSAHYYGNADGPLRRPTDLADAVGRALRVREGSADPTDRLEAAYLRLLPEHLRTGRSPLPCRALRASCYVAADGTVHPCTVYGRPLGNLYERPLAEILDGAEAVAARDVVARDACPGCWSPCEAQPTIVASLPASLFARGRPAR
jgi:MoaA/NifB/PqqE/SkfB family radical SAM enzyme